MLSTLPTPLKAHESFSERLYIHADAGEYLPFAGLYDIWTSPEGIEVYSCTIITTPPTVNLQAIHNRMPVILEPAAEEVWLNPEVTNPQELTPLLQPYTIRPLDYYTVSKVVNRAGFDSPELARRLVHQPALWGYTQTLRWAVGEPPWVALARDRTAAGSQPSSVSDMTVTEISVSV